MLRASLLPQPRAKRYIDMSREERLQCAAPSLARPMC
jgi:hypothetical protein